MTDESEQNDAILAAYKGEHANLVVTFFFIMAKIIGDRTDEKLVEYIRITKRPTVAAEKSKCREKCRVFSNASILNQSRSRQY